MELTPKEIRSIYRNASPYQAKNLMKNYVGLKICWDLSYSTVNKFRDDQGDLTVHLMDENYEVVVCEIKENDFPIIKILPAGAPVRIVGKIKSINALSIEIENAHLGEIKNSDNQIYFPEGSREGLLAFLKGKITGAEIIKIYDSHLSEDILILLEHSSPKAKIQLLGQNLDDIFLNKLKGFNLYFNRTAVVRKTKASHARFYIIDGEVFQVDSSLKNQGGNKATMVYKIDKEAETIKEDYEKWWKEASVV